MKTETMQIVEMNEGAKIPYTLDGNYLVLGDGALRLDLAQYERDDVNTIDVCMDEYNNLITSTGGKRGVYVAQVTIPAREYIVANEDAAKAAAQAVAARMTATQDALEEHSEGTETESSRLEPVPFDITRCELALWAQV